MIGKAFALLNLPSDFDGKLARGNEGMDILRQLHQLALAADERGLCTPSTADSRLGFAAVHVRCHMGNPRKEPGKANFVQILMDRHGQLSIGGECKSECKHAAN